MIRNVGCDAKSLISQADLAEAEIFSLNALDPAYTYRAVSRARKGILLEFISTPPVDCRKTAFSRR